MRSLSYNSSWAVTSVVDPNGATATTTYDSYGRPSQSTIPDGAQTSYAYTYWTSGANTQTATTTSTDLANPIWKRTTLDGFGRAVRVESGWGPSTNTQTQVDTQYAPCGCSPLGKMSAVSMPYKPSDPIVWTTYAYDERGRTVSITAPDGSATTFQYPTTVTDPANNTFTGNLVKTIDAAGKWKIQQSDAMGNLIKVLEPNPANPTGSAWLVTSYTYNGLNQLTNVSMPRSNGTQSRTFSYTGLDLTSATNPENGTVTYTYDNAHHMLTKTDAKQQQVHYNYDQYGRLTDVYRYAMINGQLTEQPAQRVHYYYDSNPVESGFSSNTNGRLAAVEMPDENANYGRVFYYEYSYSQSGRVSTQRMRVVGDIQGVSSPINFDASYGWDQEGRMTSLNYPSSGPQYSYQYDGLGRLSSLFEQGNGSPSATVTYGNSGQVLGMTYWAVSETRQYNNLLQMTRITANAFGTTVMDNQYLYTAGQNNGRITSSVDGFLGNETVNYTYDASNRLSSATATNNAWGQSFTYDGFGNMTDKNQTVGSAPSLHVTFDPATNRQTGVNYDANGNPTEGKIYDVENRIIGEPGYQWYTYDYRGKRITKLMGSTTELYFYGIDGRKLATYQCAAGTQQNNYQFTCSSPAFDTYWKGKLVKSKGQEVTTDRLGSVRWARDDGWRAYWPYGEERWGSNDNREKFGTYVRDNSTQDYADQRYYGPGTGRFHTPDPYLNSAGAGDPTSWNRYAYVQGDPMNGADPSGNNTILVSDLSIDLFKTFYTVPGVSITVTATFDPITPGATEILSLIREGDELLEGPRQKDKPPEDTGFSTPCWALPAGALLAASGSVGLLGGQSASGALFADYDNGHLYVSVSFGLQAGWNGGAAGNVSVGNVYGPNGATQSVMTGGGISLQVGAGPFVAGVQGSGPGLASPNPLLTDLANGIALTVGTGWSLFQTQFSGGVSPSSTPLVVDLGSFMQTGSGANSAVTTASPTIALGMMAAYVARQACH